MNRTVLIGDIDTFKTWGIILTKVEMNFPEPKTYYVDIPKGDGAIDLTEAMTGQVNYHNRKGKLEFDILEMPERRAEILREMGAFFHGRRLPIVLPDEPEYVYTGRLSINKVQTSYLVNKIVIDLECDPYKLKPSTTEIKLKLIENLTPNGWDDFNIMGDIENLCVDGFNSFKEYGSGKNYIKNWNFENDDLSQVGRWSTILTIENETLRVTNTGVEGDANVRFNLDIPAGEYIVRYKIYAPFGVTEFQWVNTSQEGKRVFRRRSDNVEVYETRFIKEKDGDANIRFSATDTRLGDPHKDNYMIFYWIQVTPVDKQHLVVEKTPLGNGLTRVQTWGGEAPMKLLHDLPTTSKRITNSLYIKNLKDTGIEINPNTYGESVYIGGKEEKYVMTSGVRGAEIAALQLKIRTLNIKDNLDFIASDPIINEGDKPNLTLLKEKLDNGYTHLRAYGGQRDLKLRYIKAGEKIGKPLYLGMDLENKGDEFIFKHDATSTNPTVPKGYKGYFENITSVSSGGYMYTGVETETHLDFISSDPVFYTGNPNDYNTELPHPDDIKGDGNAVAAYETPVISMPVIPKIEVSDTVVATLKGSDTRVILNKGTNTVPALKLTPGRHIFLFKGKRDTEIKISFTEGAL